MNSTKDQRTLLALAGFVCLVGQLLFFGPIEIWARNAPFMTFSGFLHAAVLGLAFIILVGAAIAIWAVLPVRLSRRIAPVTAACALLVWVYAQFLFLDSLQMNGRSELLTFSDIGAWEFLAIAAAIALLAGIAVRWTREVTVGLVILISAQSALLAFNLASNWRNGRGLTASDVDLAPLWRVSKSDGVFVFVLDTLQSDVAQEALSDPGLAAQFAGFTFFNNATGIAPTTYPSMPAIHSGMDWDLDTSLLRQYENNVKQRSFLAQLARAGYDTTQVNPVYGICAEGTTLCISASHSATSRYNQFAKETIRLFDLSLLKASPLFWRNDIYNNGFLFFSTMVGDSSTAKHVLDDLAFISDFSEKMTVEGEQKTAKFIHLLSTHPPFVLKDDCKMHDHAATESPVAAARCSLRAIANIFSRLRVENAIENALIIIVADHGGMRFIPSTQNAGLGLAPLMAAANPALIVRFPGAHGALHENDKPVSITDIAATVCEATTSCVALGGEPLQHAKTKSDGGRRRIFNHYSWKTEYWTLSKVPDVRTFEIAGDVRDRASWRRIGAVPRLVTGSVIDFRGATSDRYLGLGWSGPEPWGRWTEGPRATLRLSAEARSGSDLVLNLRALAFLGSKRRQEVVVNVNDLRVGEWIFVEPDVVEKSFRIPASALRPDHILDIELKIGSPERPRDIGLNDDPRWLGLGLIEARITAN